jgi:hypothetical protein
MAQGRLEQRVGIDRFVETVRQSVGAVMSGVVTRSSGSSSRSVAQSGNPRRRARRRERSPAVRHRTGPRPPLSPRTSRARQTALNSCCGRLPPTSAEYCRGAMPSRAASAAPGLRGMAVARSGTWLSRNGTCTRLSIAPSTCADPGIRQRRGDHCLQRVHRCALAVPLAPGLLSHADDYRLPVKIHPLSAPDKNRRL